MDGWINRHNSHSVLFHSQSSPLMSWDRLLRSGLYSRAKSAIPSLLVRVSPGSEMNMVLTPFTKSNSSRKSHSTVKELSVHWEEAVGSGEGAGREKFGINRYTLLYTKQGNNTDLLYSTGNYI